VGQESGVGPTRELEIIEGPVKEIAQPWQAQKGVETKNPGGVLYYKAWAAAQEAEKLEKAGKFGAALEKLKVALETLDELSRKYPDWEPQLVAYRTQKTKDLIQWVNGRMANPKPGGQAGEAETLQEEGPG
jgi:hypothetical protein